MTLLRRALKYCLMLSGAVINKLTLLLTSPLTYAPAGWDTVIPDGDNTGWNYSGVTQAEEEKWSAFCHAVAGVGPLGFSHEHTDLSITNNVSFHNVNITYGYALSLAAHGKTGLSVLDYGGGLGHFYQLGRALLPELELNYSCKEFPQTVRLGERLNPEINWYSDDSCLDNSYDLVMISGSLQYIQHWQQFLHDVAASVNIYLFLTRVPVVNTAASFVAVQKAYGARMLHWQFNRGELLHAIKDAGFTIVREVLAGDSPYIKNAPEQCDLRGWILQKKRN